ncbi:hypothetical protein ACH4Y0_04440 [Streptomyces sp. NPDC020707]|uniref:hypothetical protein n=1 Tax=Streptomyces sp. NPDC020707 TaxID=3365084 RepID=UPI00379807A1
MPDNTATGPFKDRRDGSDRRDERGDVTRTPGTTGAAHGDGSGAGRDDVLGGRDTAEQERVRDGQDTMVGGRIPAATGPRTPEQERSPGREGGAGQTKIASGTGTGTGTGTGIGTGKAAPGGGRSGASREGILGAEARVNAGKAKAGTDSGGRLMPHDEGDKWSQRLHDAVAGFVDGPRGSVEEADRVLQEVAERFTEAVTQRRRALGTSWQSSADDKADTEQLRLALKDYRELTERLLRI